VTLKVACEHDTEKNYWADFEEIWQEDFMVDASYLINFWMTLA
jgi:hypothetical protein